MDEKAFGDAVLGFQEELKKAYSSSPPSSGVKIYPEPFFMHPTSVRDYQVTFCDGGNYPLIVTHFYALEVNRVFLSTWRGAKRLAYASIDFFSMTRQAGGYVSSVVWPLSFTVKGYGLGAGDLEPIVRMDEENTLVRYRELGGLEALLKAAQIPRRIGERRLMAAAMAAGSGFFVFDGLLQAEVPQESSAIQKAVSLSEERGLMVAGFAKTAGLLDPGTLPKSIFTRTGEWYARIGETETRDSYIYAVRFHRSSLTPYVVEVSKRGAGDYDSFFRALFSDSLDPHLPGYPHGLLDADRHARVRRHEAERLRARFISKLPVEQAQEILRQERAITTHEALNLISSWR
ncbi:MAG: hypothetical protein RXR41_03815 [Candidatus Marsarchaeota archaeon]